MTKPLHEFGGWLRFFHVTNWINLVVAGINLIFILLSMANGKHQISTIESVCMIIRSFIVAYIFFQMITETKTQNGRTIPTSLTVWITWYLWTTVIFGILVGGIQYFVMMMPWMETLIRVFGTMIGVTIWWYIWTSYFKESKRVLAYYGENA